jgi:glycosyltransferase involved in cell wall biosynthesis/GT2 family glycosyltransferase
MALVTSRSLRTMTHDGNDQSGSVGDIAMTPDHLRRTSDAAELRMVFVLEQALGHMTHGRNIESVLAEAPGIAASVIRIEQPPASMTSRLPLVSTWSFEASWATRSALRKRLAQGPADALFVHTQVAALLSVPEMRAVPTVISMDSTPINIDDFGYGHTRQGMALERAKWHMNRRALDAAAAVVTFSHWAADSVVGDYRVPEHKVRVVRPGVDLARFRPAINRRANTRPRVLFVGGDFSRKGGEDLIEAMKLLDGEAELDVVTGVRPRSIPTASPTRVHLGLNHASEELFELYRQADIFVLPAIGECYGHVICEAMASGLPVVATNIGAIPEIVEDGVSGLLVPPSSPAELADALRTLVRRPDQRRSMGERGLQLAHRDHDARRNIESVLELMTGLSRSRRNGPEGRRRRPAPQPRQPVEKENEMSRRSEQLDIAVVVPTRNRPSDLRRCLASLATAVPPRCSVTVVDQSTDMQSAAVFKELVGGLDAFDYVASDRTGVSIARNQGARSVGGDLVLFIDDDCEVTRDWVDHWRQFFEAHPTVDIAFGKVAVPEFDRTAGHIPGFDPGHQDTVWGSEVFSRGAGFVGMGANMAVRRDAFDDVGGFDELLGPGARFRAGDDPDLALRMVRAGHRLGHAAQPTVTHYGFRSNLEASRLGHGYATGTAAMYVKLVRCHDWAAARFMARDISRLVTQIVRCTLTGERPTGFNSLRGFVTTIPGAASCPVDVDRRVYTPAELVR